VATPKKMKRAESFIAFAKLKKNILESSPLLD
jgi:hypothetical protein